jgi:hypothetical membrane protein
VLSPAPVLALLVGIFHSGLYVLLRGSVGARVPLIVLAAALGAWAGDAIGARIGLDAITIGDFHVVAASLIAWAGIAIVSLLAVLGPAGRSAS